MRSPLHDYSSGAGYFITFSTRDKLPLFGNINKHTVDLSPAGMVLQQHWQNLPTHFPALILDAFQIMPDHVHCIIIVPDFNVAGVAEGERYDLPKVMQGFKAYSAMQIKKQVGGVEGGVWQDSYYDRVIRSEKELEKFRYYIETNPIRAWQKREHSSLPPGLE